MAGWHGHSRLCDDHAPTRCHAGDESFVHGHPNNGADHATLPLATARSEDGQKTLAPCNNLPPCTFTFLYRVWNRGLTHRAFFSERRLK